MPHMQEELPAPGVRPPNFVLASPSPSCHLRPPFCPFARYTSFYTSSLMRETYQYRMALAFLASGDDIVPSAETDVAERPSPIELVEVMVVSAAVVVAAVVAVALLWPEGCMNCRNQQTAERYSAHPLALAACPRGGQRASSALVTEGALDSLLMRRC